jgi:hypothetical protein
MREKRFFGLTCEGPTGNVGPGSEKNLPTSGTNCRSEAMFRNRESHHITGFFAMARRLLTDIGSIFLFGAQAMLPAIGAASAALDAIQSLTSPQPGSSSQSTDFFGALSDAGDSSAASSGQSIVPGFSGTQISSDNLNALFDAQSLSSGNVAGSLDSGSSTSESSDSDSSSASAPGTASSAYSAINQLTQSAAIPLAFSPFSVSA